MGSGATATHLSFTVAPGRLRSPATNPAVRTQIQAWPREELLAAARARGVASTPFTVHDAQGEITGTVTVTAREGEPTVTTAVDQAPAGAGDELRILDACEHVEAFVAGRLPRLYPGTSVSAVVLNDVADVHAAAEAARARLGAETFEGAAYGDDPAAFQAAYRRARDAITTNGTGRGAVPFRRDNATGGLGARGSGRGFGVELEFDFPPEMSAAARADALRAIGAELCAAGITDHPHQSGYHSNRRGFTRWRFESDVTVAGEIVSPILYDEPQSWDRIAQVCDIVARHGGTASARTGGHVHVSCGDYDHTVENHANLLNLVAEHEDTLFRLAQNPEARRHRGLSWCRPNQSPTHPPVSVESLVHWNSSHGYAINFESMHGRRTDHVEFRMWDGSLDPGVIQAQVNLSLGMANHAFRTRNHQWAPREAQGTHHSRNRARLGPGQRLRGDDWRADTSNFRRLVDRIFPGAAQREQATALFAATRWQRPQ